MSILNRTSDGLLTVLLALRRALIAYGPQTESRLLELCAPASVVPGGKPEMARKTLNRWTQLGLFRENDGRLDLHPDILRIGAVDLDGLRSAVLRLILAPENNPMLSSDSESDVENSLASDCTRAMAWALTQDPFAFQAIVPHRAAEDLESRQGVRPRLFQNSTRWDGFKEWSVFLGIAFSSSKGIVLNPAFAVRTMLGQIFAGVHELPQDVFRAQLAEALPVLDGGRYQAGIQGEISRPWRTLQSNHISPCLSLALLTLEVTGDIRIPPPRSDAPLRLLLGRGGRELRSFSHVGRAGAQ
jgi:hypothetical protein